MANGDERRRRRSSGRRAYRDVARPRLSAPALCRLFGDRRCRRRAVDAIDITLTRSALRAGDREPGAASSRHAAARCGSCHDAEPCRPTCPRARLQRHAASAARPARTSIVPVPDRWNLPLPEWDRYGVRGDYPYVSGHWWDPYNQNELKGDYPVFGTADVLQLHGHQRFAARRAQPAGAERRRAPSGRGSERFFGRGGIYVPVTVDPDVVRPVPRRHRFPPD